MMVYLTSKGGQRFRQGGMLPRWRNARGMIVDVSLNAGRSMSMGIGLGGQRVRSGALE